MMSQAVLSVLLTSDGWSRYGALFTRQFWDSPEGQLLFDTVESFWQHAGDRVQVLDDDTLEALITSSTSQRPELGTSALKYIRAAQRIPQGKRDPLIRGALKDWATRNEMLSLIQDLEAGRFDPADAAVRMDKLSYATRDTEPPRPAHLSITEDVKQESISQVYPTGITDIDRLLKGGVWAGEIAIAYAPSFRGKTWFLVNQGARALQAGIPVQHHTFKTEVNARRAKIRYYQNLCEARREDIIRHPRKYAKVLEAMALPPWHVVEHEGFPTTGHIRQLALRFIKECTNQGIKARPLIIVDYLGLVSPADRSAEGRWSYLNRTRELRHIAASFDVALWTAHQTNRPTYKATHIRKEDASEAIGVTETADVIITLNQTPMEEQIGVQRWYIDKAREREFHVPEWHVRAVKEYQRFESELTPEQEERYYG